MSIEKLIASHIGWLRKNARIFYADADNAEDLASETILKCLAQSHRFDPSRGFRQWAFTIMANTYRTQYRRNRCISLTGYEGYSFCSAEDYADQRAIVGMILSIIRKCHRQSVCIECVILYAKGFCYEEIGNMMHIPVGTVRSRISAGRKMIRKALSDTIVNKC